MKRLTLGIGIPKVIETNKCDTVGNGSPNGKCPQSFFIDRVCGISDLTESKQGTKEQGSATIYSPPSSSFKASALRSTSEGSLFFRSREERNISRNSLKRLRVNDTGSRSNGSLVAHGI